MKLFILLLTCQLFRFAATCQVEDSIKNSIGTLYYQTYGAGEPIVVLNGGPGGTYKQVEIIATTLGENYKCILPQQRGTGKSTAEPFDTTTINLRTAVNDLRLLLQHTKATKATFIGHSWGAMLAMAFAATYPTNVKRLILITPGPYKNWKDNYQVMQDIWKSRMGRNEQKIFDSVNNIISGGEATKDDSLIRRKLILETYTFNKAFSDTVQAQITGVGSKRMGDLMIADLQKQYDLTDALKRFKGPVHIIDCRQDYVAYNAYEIKQLLTSAQIHWINECGHWPQFEQPEQFFGLLNEILTSKQY